MQYHGCTDVGMIRQNNEDSFGITEFSNKFVACVVADGMGGYAGGKEASSIAVEMTVKALNDAAKYFDGYTDRQIENFLKNTTIKINKSIYLNSLDNKELNGMGTTLVICIVYNGRYFVSNVGDSRMYIQSASGLEQITKDHSYVYELMELGMITKEQAMVHPQKNVITKALGSESPVVPDIYKGRLESDDVLLVCTDGLTNMVTEQKISDVITQTSSPEDICNRLVTLAKENGGKDNITVAVINQMNGGDSIQ